MSYVVVFLRMKILDIPQSGSVGAVTSSRNRSGQYRRQRAMPTQPRTASQIAARSRLTTTSAAWRGLTDTQRAAWAAFASSFTVMNSLGTAIALTGHQCFVKVNTVNILLGAAVVLVPPALPSFAASTITGIAMAFTGQTFALNGAAAAAGTDIMIFASPQLSAGVSYNGQFRYIGKAGVFTTGVYSMAGLYIPKFGALIAGKKIFVKVVQNQAGMQDNGTLFASIVAA